MLGLESKLKNSGKQKVDNEYISVLYNQALVARLARRMNHAKRDTELRGYKFSLPASRKPRLNDAPEVPIITQIMCIDRHLESVLVFFHINLSNNWILENEGGNVGGAGGGFMFLLLTFQ